MPPLNILLFTADDLHCGSIGCFGGAPAGLTPNIDRFAADGVRFARAHVNAAICMPSRIVLGTGLYSHNSGAMGFMHARDGTPGVIGLFQRAGYRAGILGKLEHSTPCPGDRWDYAFDRMELGNGRDPELYYERSRAFLDRCRAEGRPFYFMVNSHDPHRPFHVAGRPIADAKEPSRVYAPDEAHVPGFLPDLPGVREELSTYQNSTRRLDDTFGRVMDALAESGFEDSTLVMFLSDNGIAVPFAKCNCYLASTLTPWIVRGPGVAEFGRIDREHFISGVDFLPTVLEAAGVAGPDRLDGTSFVPLLGGGRQAGRKRVFTQIDRKADRDAVPMRCVQDARWGYIFNAWSDGRHEYHNANEGLSMKAMEEAAARGDAAVAERVRMFRYRVLEELYDMAADPDCLVNRIDDPACRPQRDELTAALRQWMIDTADPLREAFDARGDPAALAAAVKRVYS